MSKKQLSKEETKEMFDDIKKANRDQSKLRAVYRGATKVGKQLGELTIGAAGAGTLALAVLQVRSLQAKLPDAATYPMVAAVSLMIAVALSVLGKYLIQKGRQ